MTIAHVGTDKSAVVAASGTTITIQPSETKTAGNMLFLAVSTNENSVPTCADNSSQAGTANSYTVVVVAGPASPLYFIYCNLTRNILSTNTITVTVSTCNRKSLSMMEFSGLKTSGGLDQHTTGTGTTSPLSSGTTSATTVANELVITAWALNTGSTTASGFVDAGYTKGSGTNTAQGTTNREAQLCYKIVSATGTQNDAPTCTAITNYAASIYTFSQAISVIIPTTCAMTSVQTASVIRQRPLSPSTCAFSTVETSAIAKRQRAIAPATCTFATTGSVTPNRIRGATVSTCAFQLAASGSANRKRSASPSTCTFTSASTISVNRIRSLSGTSTWQTSQSATVTKSGFLTPSVCALQTSQSATTNRKRSISGSCSFTVSQTVTPKNTHNITGATSISLSQSASVTRVHSVSPLSCSIVSSQTSAIMRQRGMSPATIAMLSTATAAAVRVRRATGVSIWKVTQDVTVSRLHYLTATITYTLSQTVALDYIHFKGNAFSGDTLLAMVRAGDRLFGMVSSTVSVVGSSLSSDSALGNADAKDVTSATALTGDE